MCLSKSLSLVRHVLIGSVYQMNVCKVLLETRQMTKSSAAPSDIQC